MRNQIVWQSFLCQNTNASENVLSSIISSRWYFSDKLFQWEIPIKIYQKYSKFRFEILIDFWFEMATTQRFI